MRCLNGDLITVGEIYETGGCGPVLIREMLGRDIRTEHLKDSSYYSKGRLSFWSYTSRGKWDGGRRELDLICLAKAPVLALNITKGLKLLREVESRLAL